MNPSSRSRGGPGERQASFSSGNTGSSLHPPLDVSGSYRASSEGYDLSSLRPLEPALEPAPDDPLRTPRAPWATGASLLASPPPSEYAPSLHSVRSADPDDPRSLLSPNDAEGGATRRHRPTGIGVGHPPRSPRTPGYRPSGGRAYDDAGLARTGPLGMIARSPTIRRMSTTIRNASIRMANNIMGSEKDGYEGLDGANSSEEELAEMPSQKRPRTPPPAPPPPSTPPPPPMHAAARNAPPRVGLRGRTLCVFSATNPLRVAMNKLLLFPWTEPLILVLILANAIILTIQAAPPLFTPRKSPGGFFQGWEDYALFALFIVFTVEMFARMVVTGLILDPETTVGDFMRRAWAMLLWEVRSDHDPAAKDKGIREPWHVRRAAAHGAATHSAHLNTKPVMLSEAPFEEAVSRQRGLIVTNRPYLRHSWYRIDMVAVVSFWIMFILASTGQEATEHRHLYIFRALSILRTTRLLVVTSGTATILHSLKRAGPLILKVSVFIVFAAALFSIIGVQSFRGSLRRECILTDPYNPADNDIVLGSCGGWLDPVTFNKMSYMHEDGNPTNIAPKGFICPLNQVCWTRNESLEDNSKSFDNIFKSLVQVLIIAGVNTWTDTMYETMDAEFFSSTLFFIVAIIVINLWLMNLLVAVVVNTFQDIRAETKKSAFGADNSILAQPDWASDSTKRPREPSRLFKLYQKTEIFWALLIVVDLISQGCKSASASGQRIQLLRTMELVFSFVFLFEIGLRMIAYAPDWRAFIKSTRNDFDLFIAVGGAIIQIPVIRNSSVYPWLTIFHLLRWYRVILLVPRMKPLLINVFGSFTGLLNMVFFLFLITFLSALMAVQFLRGDMEDDDNMINFSQAYNAFLGMYQIFSTENWTTVLYNALAVEWGWGQGWIICIFLFLWFMFANFILMQMFIAVINENFSIAEEQKRKEQIESFIRKTQPESAHVSWIERLNPYRLIKGRHKAVKVDAVPQNLILPLKQSIGQDVGAPDEPEEASGKAAMKKLFGIAEDGMAIPLRTLRKRRKQIRPTSSRLSHFDDDDDDDRGLTDLLPTLTAGPSVDEHKDELRERRNQQADFISAHPSYDKSLWLFSQKSRVRQVCQMLVAPAYGQRIFGRPEHPLWSQLFRAFIFLTVVASIVIAAIVTPEYRRNYYNAHGYDRVWFDYTEAALALVFVMEFAVKVIADGFIFAPNAYLLSIWNLVDFFILLALLVNAISSLVVFSGVNRATRAFKAFRALRLITLFSRLRDTFYIVFFAGFTRILDASVLMIMYLIPFAVWGLNIFSRKLTSCNDSGSNISGRADCVSEYLASPVGDELQFLAPRAWANPSFDGSIWAFDDFRQSILILFEIVSLEGWTDVMASAMNIVDIDLQPQTNASQWNSIFFVIFILFGGVIILTVFLSIIIENFSIGSGAALLTAEQRQWEDLSKYIRQQTPSQLPRRKPKRTVQLWCYHRATEKRGYWSRFFTFLYFVHMVLLMTEDYSSNIMTESQLDVVFLVLTVLYAVDLLVRFYGLGFKSFRSNGWNIFDVVVITGCFATTIPALQASASGVEGNQASKQVQKLFLVAVTLKLVQRLDSLNQLFKTSVASLPAIGNLFLLWAVLFVFAAIVYVEIFGLTKQGPSAESRYQNYYSFGNALVMLAFMSTGEGWNSYMHDYTMEFPRCTDSSDYYGSDCGSVGWAYVLFISWNILSMYIFLNMFTGVVVQSFSYVYQVPGAATLNREQIRSFKQAWAQVDVNRTGYIKRKDFPNFFARLNGVFEVRLYPVEYSIPSLLRNSVPEGGTHDPMAVYGTRYAVDVRKLEGHIAHIDFAKVHRRRNQYIQLYYEAKITEEAGRGISFTNMLLMLAHYTLIKDEDALQVNDLLLRRAKMERVKDLVNLDRVRGLLRTIYWRRRFKAWREDARRAAALETRGMPVPEIVLERSPNNTDGFAAIPSSPLHVTPTHSPPVSPPLSPRSPRTPTTPMSPRMPHSPTWSSAGGHESVGHGTFGHGAGGDEGLSVDSSHWTYASTATPRASVLSADTLGPAGHTPASPTATVTSHFSDYSREPSLDEPDPDDVVAAMATSVWGDMMRAADDDSDDE